MQWENNIPILSQASVIKSEWPCENKQEQKRYESPPVSQTRWLLSTSMWITSPPPLPTVLPEPIARESCQAISAGVLSRESLQTLRSGLRPNEKQTTVLFNSSGPARLPLKAIDWLNGVTISQYAPNGMPETLRPPGQSAVSAFISLSLSRV